MDLFANELVAEHSKMHQYQLIDIHVLNQVQSNPIWLVWEYSIANTTLICIFAEATFP